MPSLTAARNAVALTFFLNGLVFSSWVSRIPEARSSFALTNGQLGLVLLAIALGSVLALPTTGAAITTWGTVRVVRLGAVAAQTLAHSGGENHNVHGALPRFRKWPRNWEKRSISSATS